MQQTSTTAACVLTGLEPAFGPLPTSFIIARDGRICGKHDGFTPKEEFEREIVLLL